MRLIIIAFFLMMPLTLLSCGPSFGESKPNMTILFTPNPDVLDLSKQTRMSFSVLIKNEGNMNITINSIHVQSPILNTITDAPLPFNLSIGNTYSKDIYVNASSGSNSGNYKIYLIVDSNFGDYVSQTEIQLKNFEFIPLSGDIPLSFFVILVSGFISYIVAFSIIQRKLDTSIFSMIIFGAIIGLVNWTLLNFKPYSGGYLYLFSKISDFEYTQNLIGSIHNDPLTIFLLIIIGIVNSLIFALVFMISKVLYSKIRLRLENRKAKKLEKLIQENKWLVSFEEYSQDIFVHYIEDEIKRLDITYGKNFFLKVRVNLNHKINNSDFIDGILTNWNVDRPFSLMLAENTVYQINDIKKLDTFFSITRLENGKKLRVAIQDERLVRYLTEHIIDNPDYRKYLSSLKDEFRGIEKLNLPKISWLSLKLILTNKKRDTTFLEIIEKIIMIKEIEKINIDIKKENTYGILSSFALNNYVGREKQDQSDLITKPIPKNEIEVLLDFLIKIQFIHRFGDKFSDIGYTSKEGRKEIFIPGDNIASIRFLGYVSNEVFAYNKGGVNHMYPKEHLFL